MYWVLFRSLEMLKQKNQFVMLLYNKLKIIKLQQKLVRFLQCVFTLKAVPRMEDK